MADESPASVSGSAPPDDDAAFEEALRTLREFAPTEEAARVAAHLALLEADNTKLKAENAALKETLRGLPPTFAASLLLSLKAECEAQHARAETAETALAQTRDALHGLNADYGVLLAQSNTYETALARLRDGLETLLAKRVSYYTYVKSGGCAKCADRVGDRYVPVLGHKPDCPIKALTDARDRGDYDTVCTLLAEPR